MNTRKPEKAFWRWLDVNMAGSNWLPQRIEDKYSRGIPDVIYSCNDTIGAIELKCYKNWFNGKLLHFTAKQANWLTEHGKRGEHCYILIKIKQAIMLFDWRSAHTLFNNKWNKESLLKESLFTWIDKFNRVEFINIICEKWVDIPGYVGIYKVSSLGRIKSLDRYHNYPGGKKRLIEGVLLSSSIHTSGYLKVVLQHLGKRKTRFVHKVVVESFMGPCPEGQETMHLDNNRKNPWLNNLKYGTPQQNNKMKIDFNTIQDQRGDKNPNHVLNGKQVKQIKGLLDEGVLLQREIAEQFRVSRGTIGNIKHGRTWKT